MAALRPASPTSPLAPHIHHDGGNVEAAHAGRAGGVPVVIKGFYAQEEGKARVEKQTDTNIAISVVRDALMSPRDERHNSFRADPFAPCDGVVLISGDRDLQPAAKMIAHYGVTPVIFRPGREITDEDLVASLLPDKVARRDGSFISWNDYAALKTGRGRW